MARVLKLKSAKLPRKKIANKRQSSGKCWTFAPQFVAVFGPNRERLYVNRGALDYLGISLDEWRQRSFALEFIPDDSERFKTYADRALSTGAAYELEVRLRKK